ncbi:Auxin response factor 8 [Sarracenia purpurea var. burkii]
MALLLELHSRPAMAVDLIVTLSANEKNQLLLGIRRAIRPQTVMPSSVLSSDSMHIGLFAAAAHAATTNSCFTIFYNPRASPSEFVIPLSKYVKAAYHLRVSVGMRFRMLFETEESSVRRYMGTITGISDLDPVRWPNSHWRSVKVGWDESTAGERQPRVSVWEIEPLTTFSMYPSLFPLRLKHPWYPGTSSFQDSNNGMTWLRGEAGEQGLHSINLQNIGMFPGTQQGVDATFVRNDFNQQYQAMLAAGLQNIGSGDSLKQQFLQLQQPFQYLHHSGSQNPLLQLQQAIQPSIPSHILPAQTQMLPENMHRQQVNNQPEEQRHQHTYQDSFLIRSDQLQQRPQFNIPSPPFSKTDFTDSNAKFSNMLGSVCAEGGGNIFNFLRTGQSMLSEPSQLPMVPKFTHLQSNSSANSVSLPPYPGKDAVVGQENCSLDAQNHALFDANVDSGLLLPTTLSRMGTTSVNADASAMPLGASGLRSSLYGCIQDSSELSNSAAKLDPPTPTRTFVKVYKSGSVGRSLDITRFNSYHELREELGRMFGIEGLLEDPRRSGWQLVFVDRENDVLLLGDDPWEAFVNNVWYIKILSPEDVQKLGRQEVESFSHDASGEGMNGGRSDAQDLVSGLSFAGSLEY